jgi:single-strand DNA-binding protein
MADRITVVGSLGSDPEERSTSKGSVVQFRLASTDRRRDAQGNWSDGPTSWYRVNAWGELGRNALASLRKGQRVIVSGDLSISEWDGADGHKNRSVEIRAAALGHDLAFGRTAFERVARAAQQQGTAGQHPQPAQAPATPPAPPVDHSNDWGVTPGSDAAPQAAREPDWVEAPF